MGSESLIGRWGTGDYSYDGLGNIMSRNLNGSNIGYHYNGLNRLNNLSGAYAYGYQYDSRGNVTHNGRYGLAYNLGQQLTAAKGIAYVYDGHNRRVRKTENGTNSYSVYSQGGQLLHRRDADGSQTDSIYLGKTLVAEVYGGTPPPMPPPTTAPLPQVNLSLTTLSSGGECPPKMICTQVTNGSSRHVLSWSSSYASSCSGLVNKSLNGANKGTILLTGTSNFGISLAADGTLYSVSLTCTGAGGQTTKEASCSGTGAGMEM